MGEVPRRRFLAAAGIAALGGCSALRPADGGGSDRPRSEQPPATTPDGSPTIAEASLPPVADQSLVMPGTPRALRKKALSGGVPRDGIPSIDAPTFEPASAVGERLDANAIVFGLARNGVAKAYPQNILVHHEICNDRIDGRPIAVTYCPLTGTVLGFDRGETTFGVSGRLLNNNLIMYDRATELWWPQVLGTSLPSPWADGYTRRSLRDFRLVWTTWERWQEQHPDTLVLAGDTGYVRDYGSDPYGTYDYPEKLGYYAPDSKPMFPSMSESDQFAPKRVVMGARTPQGAVAFRKDALRERRLMEGSLAGTPVLAVYDPRLDTGYVYRNPERRSFAVEDEAIADADGSVHAPDALPLARIHTFDAMWFAWSGFYPETNVYG